MWYYRLCLELDNKSFLVNRVDSVKVNSCVSPDVTVTYCVPQGTVLGPLLFLCCSADLTNSVKHSTVSMFADDTKLYKSNHTVHDCYLLQEGYIWQTELSLDKSNILPIGNSKINFDYSLQSKIIRKITSMKDVGITVQSNLKFTNNCTEVK